MSPTPEIKARINLFVTLLQALYDQHYAEKFAILVPPLITLEYGTKYVRVVTNQRRKDDAGNIEPDKYGRSVYCFIDLSNGDILKAAGWKAPAKGARGSIFNENCDVGTRANVYGGGLYIR